MHDDCEANVTGASVFRVVKYEQFCIDLILKRIIKEVTCVISTLQSNFGFHWLSQCDCFKMLGCSNNLIQA